MSKGCCGKRRREPSLDERMVTIRGHLTARIIRVNGEIECVDLGRNTIGDAAVAYLVDDMDGGATDISTMGYHAWGTGACATPVACATAALNVEAAEARVLGAKTQPTAPQFRTIATITAAAPRVITEWGLFSQLAVGGTAWSLRCWAAAPINLAGGDSIEFTYTVTFACVQA